MRIELKKIMCAIDFSESVDIILSYGKSLAKEFGSTLFLCHIVQRTIMVSSHLPAYVDYTDVDNERAKNAKERLEEIIQGFDIECEIIIATGHPPDEIEKVARQNNVDMVIAATYGGSGIKRFLIGSVTSRLVKILTCPFLVLNANENHLAAKSEDSIKLKRILVGCNFSPDSQLAFDYALSLAQEFQTQLHLAYVLRPTEHTELSASDYLKIQEGDYIGWNRLEYLNLKKKSISDDEIKKSSTLNRIERQLSNMVPEESQNWCSPVTVLLEGQPYQALINYAEQNEVDMIVLGVRGHSLLEQFLVGSTTDRVISRSSCPVLAVRQLS